jgi:hypothetical protein
MEPTRAASLPGGEEEQRGGRGARPLSPSLPPQTALSLPLSFLSIAPGMHRVGAAGAVAPGSAIPSSGCAAAEEEEERRRRRRSAGVRATRALRLAPAPPLSRPPPPCRLVPLLLPAIHRRAFKLKGRGGGGRVGALGAACSMHWVPAGGWGPRVRVWRCVVLLRLSPSVLRAVWLSVCFCLSTRESLRGQGGLRPCMCVLRESRESRRWCVCEGRGRGRGSSFRMCCEGRGREREREVVGDRPFRHPPRPPEALLNPGDRRINDSRRIDHHCCGFRAVRWRG